jgi:exo-beta-1,3-glucanase (GH17 family)
MAIRQWIVALVLLFVISLTGCTPAAEPTPTQPPTAIPTPEASAPETPVTVPEGPEVTVEPGRTISIRASAMGADRYEWKLQGKGEISSSTEPAILYTAPEEGAIAILTVIAHNKQGASPPTLLTINVLPIATVRLDALAIPADSTQDRGDSESFISYERSLNDCHTGSDCLRFTYRAGGGGSNVYWWPMCIGMIMHIKCQETGEWSSVYEGPLCIALIRRQAWDEVQRGTCGINVLKAGNLSAIRRLTLWARGDHGGEIVTFSVGGVGVSPDPGRSTGRVTLTPTWELYTIDLQGLDLTNAIVLFRWYATDADNPQGAVFYLDDIQFEGEPIKITATQPSRLPQHAEQHLVDLFTRLCWVAYSPTHFDPTATPIRWPSEDDVREDLRVLRSVGFNGLVTYASNYADQDRPGQMLDISRLAQEAGFKGIIVGVWDPTNEDELQAAEQAGRHPVVVGYSVGNEGLDVRYDRETLVSAMERLRQATGKPVSTTEEANDYYENSPLWTISDWIFPNVHPYFAGQRDPQEAVEWTEKVFETLESVSDEPLIFKEVGLPSGGDRDLSESRQARYYQLLQQTNVTYVVFEAFDAPWKHLGHPGPDGTYWPDPEPHWGIFTSDRTPKEAVAGICPAR